MPGREAYPEAFWSPLFPRLLPRTSAQTQNAATGGGGASQHLSVDTRRFAGKENRAFKSQEWLREPLLASAPDRHSLPRQWGHTRVLILGALQPLSRTPTHHLTAC